VEYIIAQNVNNSLRQMQYSIFDNHLLSIGSYTFYVQLSRQDLIDKYIEMDFD